MIPLAAAFLLATSAALTAPAEAQRFDAHALTVLIFVGTECPIANGGAPEINRVYAAYQGKDVAFYRVYADATLDAAEIEKHGKDYNLPMPAVHDKDLDLVHLTGAEVTPEAVVYDRSGARRYRGRIDNRYEDLGKYRQKATKRDLNDALEALLAGKEVATPETKAVGCYLPQPKESKPNPTPQGQPSPSPE